MISKETLEEIKEAFQTDTKFGNLLAVASSSEILDIIQERIKEMPRDEVDETAEIFLMLYSIQMMDTDKDSRIMKELIQSVMRIKGIRELVQLSIAAYARTAMDESEKMKTNKTTQ